MPPFRAATLLIALCIAATAAAEPRHTVVIVIDGLRPDYVTPEQMPRLHALGCDGVWFERHRAVFPTVTRVNAASISTGCYPGKHGLMDNTVYFPEVGARPLTTSDHLHLQRIEEATGGKLLGMPTLGELLAEQGKKLLVVSSGSTGSAFLLNHKAAGAGIIHTEYAIPGTLHERVHAVLGPPPGPEYPNTGRVDRAVEAYLRIGLDEIKPEVAILWLTEPDHTAHAMNMGAPETRAALAGVDAAVGRLLDGLDARGIAGQTDVIVTSDHGFTNNTGTLNPFVRFNEILRELRGDPRAFVVAGSGVYLGEANANLLAEFATRLQREPWVGAIFTRGMMPGLPFGEVPGTLSFAAIQYAHPRAPDLLISPQWSDEVNEHGVPGAVALPGVAGHGSASPWDIRGTMIAAGPRFKRGVRNPVPAGNVDIAPTILSLHGVPVPTHMDGRVIDEALASGPDPAGRVATPNLLEAVNAFPGGGTYQIILHQSLVGRHAYLDHAEVNRDLGDGAGTPPRAIE